MHSNPGFHQRSSRSTLTLSSLTASQLASSCSSRPANNGTKALTSARKASSPRDWMALMPPLWIT